MAIDISTVVGGIVAAVAVPIILDLIQRTVRPVAVEVEGSQVLEYGRPMKLLVGVFWFCWLGFAVAVLFAPAKDQVPAAVTLVVFSLLILALHLEFFVVRVQFDDSEIRTRSPWRSLRIIPWFAIDRVWFSEASKWYVVETHGFGRIRLHVALNGVDSFLERCEARGVSVTRSRRSG